MRIPKTERRTESKIKMLNKKLRDHEEKGEEKKKSC